MVLNLEIRRGSPARTLDIKILEAVFVFGVDLVPKISYVMQAYLL
jgi:hypothetical protein